MWCRSILTAVAISYVICMLLWSGLQKEDLDPSTLEKLGRYNVNIDDMNNQQLHQECLVPQVTTEVQKEILRTSTANERNKNDVTVGIYPKIGMLLAANFEDSTVLQNEAKINMTNHFDKIPVIGEGMPDSGNATEVLGNKGIIKIEYNIQNKPNIESVMNFWTKLTRYTARAVTSLATTTVAPVTTTAKIRKAKNISATENNNNGYVHSREIEYISRILAEYLASQTVPTTTETVFTKKVFPNYFPKKYWEISNKASVEEEPKRIYKQKDINNVTEDDLHKIKETPNTQKKEPKVNQPTSGILQKLLQMRNDLFNNGVILPKTESNTETMKNNKSKEQQDTSVSFNLFNIFQNMEVNKNDFMKNDKSTRAPIKAEKWEPVPLSNENINKELKTSLIGNKKKSNQDQLLVMYDLFKTTPSIIIKPDRTKIYQDDNQDEDAQKSRLDQNSDVEHKRSRFQAMLPSIKFSKQNKKSEMTNNQVIGMHTNSNRVQQNEDRQLLNSMKAIISQQPVTIEKFPRNQLFKMKNDTVNADSGDIDQETKVLNSEQYKKTQLLQNLEPTHDPKKIKAIQEIVNNFDHDNYQLTSDNVSDTKATQNIDPMNISDVQGIIPSSIIKQIVENVKRLVLKDIGVNVNTTTVGTTSTTVAPTTIFSTSTSTTISTSEKLSTSLQNEFTQTNHVMQELLEIFKELKAMKDTVKLTNQLPQNTTTLNDSAKNLSQLPIQPHLEIPASKNPYLMKNPSLFKPIQARTVPALIVPRVKPTQNNVQQFMPSLNAQPTKDYQSGAITIQTNLDEIPPLAIQISKPMKTMNQHIVVTTKRTIDQLKLERERDSMKHIDDKIRIPNENKNFRGKLELKSDLPKHVTFAEKHEFRDRYYKDRYLDREKPWYNTEYHEKVHNMENTHPVRSRFPELHYPGRLSHLEHSGRPRDLSYSEHLSHPRGHNRPGFHQQNEMGRGHHAVSYSNSDYDRQPRYETTKFHEKLERIENWPRGAWKDFHSPSDSSNDEISARQQLPLVKVKQRKRYDDSHFTNFLKSQQKMTDMLEKLLANNVKNSGPHSVETP